MTFFDQIIELDKQLLLLGNSFHTPFLDNFMTIFSGKIIWIPAAIAILYAIVRTHGRDSVWAILALALAIVLADQISSGLIKPLVCRQRPTHEPTLEGLVTIVHNYRGGAFGFVSSHAANACAVALFTTLLFRNKLFGWAIALWAATDIYTRIYLGVHYPGDIVCGAIIGLLSAWSMFGLLRRLKPHAVAHSDNKQTAFCAKIVATTIALTTILIAIFNNFWAILGK